MAALSSSKRKQRKEAKAESVFVPDIPEPGSQEWPFKLGDEVEDPLNPQLRGILVARTYHISGCDTFTIDLLTDPKQASARLSKRTQESWPGNRLRLVKEHPDRHVDWEVPPIGEGVATIGDLVRDYVTGVEGKVTHISTVLSQSAPTVHIQPPVKDGEVPDGRWVDLNMVEVLEPYRRPDPVAKKRTFSGATISSSSSRTAA